MEINLQKPGNANIIHGAKSSELGYEIDVAGTTYNASIILTPDTLELWDVSCFEDLAATHFQQLSSLGSEVIILGTGTRLQFPDPALTRALVNRQIGLEVMDTPAACRTYNILVDDGRRVAAALILP